MITVITNEGCTQCEMTKKLLQNKGIGYEEILADEAEEYVAKAKKGVLPLLFDEKDRLICEGYEEALKYYEHI